MTFLTLGVVSSLQHAEYDNQLKVLKNDEYNKLHSAIQSITESIEPVEDDIKLLIHNSDISRLISSAANSSLQNRLASFAIDTRRYLQVRFLNPDGVEIIRVNYKNNQAENVPPQNLQDKSTRYYFQEAKANAKGEVYISPLDLNMENGVIELPHEPTIRFAEPYYYNGVLKGIFVLNYSAKGLLQRFKSATSGKLGHSGLLNNEGYYLYSHKPSRRWGFALNTEETFQKYHNDIWYLIKTRGQGQTLNSDGLFSYASICMSGLKVKRVTDVGNKCALKWHLYTELSAKELANIKHGIARKYYLIIGFLEALFLVLSFYFSRITNERVKLFRAYKTHSVALQQSKDSIVVTDENALITYINEAFEKLSGYTLPEVIGRIPSIWASKYHDEAFYDAMWQNINQAGFWRGELINAKKNGDIYTALTSIASVKGEKGNIVGYVAIESDMTEIKSLEGALMKEKAFLDAMLQNAKEAVVTVNAHGFLKSASNGVVAIFGVEVGDLVGKPLADYLYVPATRFSGRQSINRILQMPSMLAEGVLMNATKLDGSVIPVDVSGSMFDVDGLSYMVLMIRDATERYRTQQALEQKEAMLEGVLDNASDAIITCDKDGYIELFSQTAEVMFGYSSAEMLIENINTIFSDEEKESFIELKDKLDLDSHESPKSKEIHAKKRDGQQFPVTFTLIKVKVDGRELYTASIQDLTQMKALLDSVLDAFIKLDVKGNIVEWNPAAEKLFGLERHVILNKGLVPLIIPGRDRDVWLPAIERLTQKGDTDVFTKKREWTGVNKEGNEFPINVTVWPEPCNDGYYLNAFIQDITDKKQAEEMLRQSAFFDSLTGLANRAYFQKTLKSTVGRCKRQEKRFALLFLDLDKFKQINDTLGHDCGDTLLKTLAERVSNCTRQEDLVARLGGDEFTVIVEGIEQANDAAVVAEKIIASMKQPVNLNDNELYVTTSVGIATYPDCGDDAEKLMKAADIAMYRAKGDGRNCFHYYSEDMHTEVSRRVKIEQSLKKAIQNSEFTLNYQPKIDLETEMVVGFEALIRWTNNELGFVGPDEFIPIAEETGVIIEIGEWVLDAACKQLAEWINDPLMKDMVLSVAVNLSAYQFKTDLAKLVMRTVEKYSLPTSCLELEVTETAVMENVETCSDILKKMNSLGVKISIDDFGTGYSSLQYLKKLPIQTLKIDRGFVNEICTDKDTFSIIKAIIALAKSLSLEVVAEGVETKEQAQVLCAMNCDLVQGYLFSRPLPSTEVADFLAVFKPILSE